MGRVPTVDEVRAHLNARGLLRLVNASVELVAARNHLVFRVEKAGQVFCLRMINPESYRRHEWITMAEEYALLRAIEPIGLGPQAYYLDKHFEPPFLIQEFVRAACFNDLKPLAEEHLTAAARAIAILNAMDISPAHFPFMRKYVRKDYGGSGRVWYFRLFDSLRRLPRRDVLRWALRILPLIGRTMGLLSRTAPLLGSEFSFHFDGAHCGNTYWRDGRVLFLDWQKVSWRNDPSFTLVRFATSAGEGGIVPESVWQTLIAAYTEVRPLPDFGELAWVRFVERQVADLVWVLWDHARRQDSRPVEQGTSVVPRYAEVRRMRR